MQATTERTKARRWQLVHAFQRLGSFAEAATECKTSRSQVEKWVKRYQATGGVGDSPRGGRPQALKLESEDVVRVLREGVRAGLKCPALSRRLRDELNVHASPRTVARFLNKHLAKQRKPRKVPSLTTAHKAARLQFAKRMWRKSWDNVVVTDSKYFWLCPKGPGRKEWVLFGQRPPTRPSESHCHKVHVYAGVSKYGRTPLFVTVGTTGLHAASKGVNKEVYQALLQHELIPACHDLMTKRPRARARDTWVFQHDNARAHTSKHVQRWLASAKTQWNFEVMQWPAKSPDLSWIENMWGYVADRLASRRDLTAANFEAAIKQ